MLKSCLPQSKRNLESEAPKKGHVVPESTRKLPKGSSAQVVSGLCFQLFICELLSGAIIAAATVAATTTTTTTMKTTTTTAATNAAAAAATP